MYKNLLLSFIIGSSVFVVIHHWIGFYNLFKMNIGYKNKSEKFKFNKFSLYIIISTFYYGLVNVLITFLRKKYGINIHKIYFIVSLISALLIISHNLYLKILWDSYTFDTKYDKIIYSITVLIKHFINYNFIIKGLELYLNTI
jgi:hypothetical protein